MGRDQAVNGQRWDEFYIGEESTTDEGSSADGEQLCIDEESTSEADEFHTESNAIEVCESANGVHMLTTVLVACGYATIAGTISGLTGLAIAAGAMVGMLVGAVAALFTFGLSLPVGTIFGGIIGALGALTTCVGISLLTSGLLYAFRLELWRQVSHVSLMVARCAATAGECMLSAAEGTLVRAVEKAPMVFIYFRGMVTVKLNSP